MVIKEGEKLANFQLDSCVSDNRTRLHLNENNDAGSYDQVWMPCWKQLGKNYVNNVEGHWWVALIVGASPIPVGWLIAWGLVALYRWIRAGFN